MKRIIIALAFLVLVTTCRSQDLGVDMPFQICSQTGTDEQPDMIYWGDARYFREKHLPSYFPVNVLTNCLAVNLKFFTQPVSAWLVEKQTDDSFAPVFQVTNIINDPYYGCFASQEFTLTTNQIHNLIASNWFVSVDFGDSNFLVNIEPVYLFADGPTAKVVLPPVYDTRINPYYKVISLNNRDASVVFDGSPSIDPYYLPIQYSWTVWDGVRTDTALLFTNSEMKFARTLKVGMYLIVLDVSDEIASGRPCAITLDVITPAQDVNDMISNLQNVFMPIRQKDFLIRFLSLTADQFNRGHMNRGRDNLILFKKMLSYVQMNPAGVAFFSNRAQFIIDAFKKSLR